MNTNETNISLKKLLFHYRFLCSIKSKLSYDFAMRFNTKLIDIL